MDALFLVCLALQFYTFVLLLQLVVLLDDLSELRTQAR